MPEYTPTLHGVMAWANSELEHVGRIVSMKDRKLQYSYAMTTVNGMAYLKDALFQMVNDPTYEHSKKDLLIIHGNVIRAMKHLIKDFHLNLSAIRSFNTQHVLSDFSYLRNTRKRKRRQSRRAH
jgi:uncharacterized metal-binding protein